MKNVGGHWVQMSVLKYHLLQITGRARLSIKLAVAHV